jgi:hypothetical protein
MKKAKKEKKEKKEIFVFQDNIFPFEGLFKKCLNIFILS